MPKKHRQALQSKVCNMHKKKRELTIFGRFQCMVQMTAPEKCQKNNGSYFYTCSNYKFLSYLISLLFIKSASRFEITSSVLTHWMTWFFILFFNKMWAEPLRIMWLLSSHRLWWCPYSAGDILLPRLWLYLCAPVSFFIRANPLSILKVTDR